MMARARLLALLALLALGVAHAQSSGCRLSAETVRKVNSERGTAFDVNCFNSVGTKGTCGARSGGLCVYNAGTKTSCFFRSKPCPAVNATDIALQAFKNLDAAFATLSPENVAALFTTDPQGVLLPTVSDVIRNTPEELIEYFVSFLKREPRVVMDIIPGSTPNVVQLAPTVIVNTGSWTVTLKNPDAKVRARLTQVLVRQDDGSWKFVSMHSSLNPENPVVSD